MSVALFDPIKTQSKITDSVIVGFSTGKESLVVLDLCFNHFKNVYPFFMYICPDLSFQQKSIKIAEEKYNTKILQLPHPDLSSFFRYGSFRNYDFDVPVLSFGDIYEYVRLTFSCDWISCGERIADSLIRRAMIKNSSSIDIKRNRFYPLANWSKNDVFKYIKYHNLYLAKDSQKLGFSFRSLQAEELCKIKENFPDDYKKILNIFPFAEAAVKRYEWYGEK